jgi:hypothetical protein
MNVNRLETPLSRRALLKGLGVAGINAVLGSRPASAAPERVVSTQTGLLTQEAEKTQVPLPTPEQQVKTWGYEIGWENGPFGKVTLCIEKDLLERPKNWLHRIDLNTDPDLGFPDAQERLNNGIRMGMYRAWQSNDLENRTAVTFEDFLSKLEAREDLSFKAKGKNGRDPFPSEITINPADPIRFVCLSSDKYSVQNKFVGERYNFSSEKGETRIEGWSTEYFVHGNGVYGGEAETLGKLHRGQLNGFLLTALLIMSNPELQVQGHYTDEQMEKFGYYSQPATEIRDFFQTFDFENGVVSHSILTVS